MSTFVVVCFWNLEVVSKMLHDVFLFLGGITSIEAAQQLISVHIGVLTFLSLQNNCKFLLNFQAFKKYFDLASEDRIRREKEQAEIQRKQQEGKKF